MATIKTEGIDRMGIGGSRMEVRLSVQTSAGRFIFPFAVEDQGSAAANEKQAHLELRTFLQEAQQALEAL